MSNDYFNHTSTITRLSPAQSAAVNALFAAIAAGFDKLPEKAALERAMLNYVEDTGSADALECAMDPTLTSYDEGLKVRVKVAATNTGAATLDIDSLGVTSIKRIDGTDPEETDLTAGDIHEFVYDGTNFVMATPSRVIHARAGTEVPLPISSGGTGGITAAAARAALGLALPLPVASGGTGAATVADALTNLGIGAKVISAGVVNGSPTPTVSESMNVASVARSSVGVYNITFSTPEADANYITLCNVLSGAAVSYNVSHQGTVYTQIATRAAGVLADTLFLFAVIRIL